MIQRTGTSCTQHCPKSKPLNFTFSDL